METEQKSGSKKWWIVGGVIALVVAIFVIHSLSTGGTPPANGTTKDPAVGPDNALMVIREYGDFQCPACKAAHPDLKAFVDAHPTEVRLEFNDFPLPQHQFARVAAYAANCAFAQNEFWPFADILYDKQDEWVATTNPLDKFKEYIKSLGGDADKLATCTQDETYKPAVEEDISEGVAANINATPTFFVNDERVVGGLPLAAWEQKLKDLRTSTGPHK